MRIIANNSKDLAFKNKKIYYIVVNHHIQHFKCLIEQEYHNEHMSQGAEVMFGERYVYVYNLLVIYCII
jgi:hypothetical protein